ncbi:hypothetical protein HRI_003095600 [Hibiscus trionum]|uniref:SHSP domain-containing protein n=1 Tax=Hibiscus trionum TaxID=183268 RepID=A0A9W7MAI1_HIBTR|nr:hypothetical protein HRI_003095600 [Hibiscus trionum]
MQTSMETIYEDFEPLCKWRKDQTSDALEVHLPGFKRQQLKVQINTSGMLVIAGERRTDEDKLKRISRFRREFPVSEDCQPSQIHAKFSNGILYLVMPKQIIPTVSSVPSATENVKASTATSSLMNLNKRICLEIMTLAISLAIVGAYVNNYCHCSPSD